MTSIQVSGTRGGLVFTANNALQSASLLTAMNPSAANGNVGSRYILNDGGGPIVWSPNTSFESSLVAQTSTAAQSFGGSVIAMHPTQNVPYASYVPKNLSVDQTVPLLSSGNTIVTADKVSSASIQVVVGGIVHFDVSTSGLTTRNSSSVVYFDASVSGLTTRNSAGGVVFNVYNGGFTFRNNNTSYITGTNTDVQFETRVVVKGTNDNSKFRVLDATDAAVFTVGTVTRECVINGRMFLSGTNSTTKFSVIDNSAATVFNVNTTDGETTINQALSVTGTARIDGIAKIWKFAVLDPSSSYVFDVNTLSSVTNIWGTAAIHGSALSDAKLNVLDAAGGIVFEVDATPVTGRILCITPQVEIQGSTTIYINSTQALVAAHPDLGTGLFVNTTVGTTEIQCGTITDKSLSVFSVGQQAFYVLNLLTYVDGLRRISSTATIGTAALPFADVRSLLINGASDARIKNIGQPLDRIRCYDAVKNMDLYDFEYKETGAKALGFIAQQLKDAVADLPEGIVTGDESSLYSVNLMSIIAVLTGAVQRLITVVEDQKKA